MKNIRFSLVVCTNRDSSYLNTCLEKISRLNASEINFEVIVVYNGNRKEWIKNIQKCILIWSSLIHISFIHENKIGLSFARNKGYEKAKGKYIAFLDDDAQVDENWLREIENEIYKNPEHIVIGGPIFPIYNSKKPYWFDDKWESDIKGNEKRYLKKGETLSASNMVMRKDILVKYKGFDDNLGMKGDKVGLDEETDLLERIGANFGQFQYYLPQAIVYHLIAPRKMTFSYRLKRNYVGGRSLRLRRSKTSFFEKLKISIKMLAFLSFLPCYLLITLLVNHKKIKSTVIDILGKCAYAVGFISCISNFTLLFSVFIVSGLLWIIAIPLWQFPDEQAHFGQVSYIALTGRNPDGVSNDLTNEIFTSEYLLGTLRDDTGRNKFTFHPDYKIEYTNSLIGKYEADIVKISNSYEGKVFVKKEATIYPPVYYRISALIYRLFFHTDIFTRVFAIRFLSFMFYFFTLFFVYKTGHLIFSSNYHATLLTMLVGFQPMFSFANLGVTSDSLGNFLFTIFIYFSVKIIFSKPRIIEVIILLVSTFLCIITKPQFVSTVPILLIIASIYFVKSLSVNKKRIIILPIFIFIAFYLFTQADISGFTTFRTFQRELDITSLIKFTREYTLSHAYSEIMPWYWGVYKWLGVTYPRIIHRMINWVVLGSGAGFTLWYAKTIIKKKWNKKGFQILSLLILVMTVFSVPIFIYDWLSWKNSGFVLGLQGRYFFPVIVVHMAILLQGWITISQIFKKISKRVIILLPVGMMLLNYFGIYTVLKSYYTVSFSLQFINEISQYKPWFVKGAVFPGILLISFILSGLLIYRIFRAFKNYPIEYFSLG